MALTGIGQPAKANEADPVGLRLIRRSNPRLELGWVGLVMNWRL